MYNIKIFSSKHCVPCKRLKQDIDSISRDIKNIIYIDVESEEDNIQKQIVEHSISRTPTVLVFDESDKEIFRGIYSPGLAKDLEKYFEK
jgi:thioredoxin-related protein